jgi:hypothetical protein
MQVKLHLISEHEAKAPASFVLTARAEPIVHLISSASNHAGSGGPMYGWAPCFMNDGELAEGVDRLTWMKSVRTWFLAEESDDNLRCGSG